MCLYLPRWVRAQTKTGFVAMLICLFIAPTARSGEPCLVGWTASNEPAPRYAHASTYDPIRNVIVLFGGTTEAEGAPLGDTWEFDGSRWRFVAADGPAPRFGHAMAFDAGFGKVVLVGGQTAGGPQRDVWAYDGEWTRLADGPFAARRDHAMAYDSIRGRLVLFGGANDSATWLFDGSDWTSYTQNSPGTRNDAAMAFDPVRGRIVLYGSSQFGELPGRVHEWDGTGWSRTDATGPTEPRGGCALAFDPARGRFVLFGGRLGTTSTLFRETWGWNGTAWDLISSVGPTARWKAQLVQHPNSGLVLLGGQVSVSQPTGSARMDGWQLGTVGWRSTTATPEARLSPQLALDEARNQIVLFGGFDQTPPNSLNDETWVRNNGEWRPVSVGGPSGRRDGALAYNPTTQSVFMVGGSGSGNVATETWSWNGQNWTLLTSAGPSMPVGHALVFDSIANQMLLLATSQPVRYWSGTEWLVMNQNTTPPTSVANAFLDRARDRVVIASQSGMFEWSGFARTRIGDGIPAIRPTRCLAYDDARGVAVVWNGSCGSSPCPTWEWNGQTWTSVSGGGPRASDQFALAFDASVGRVTMFGGRASSGQFLSDTLEWDGNTWRNSVSGPTPRVDHAIALDRRRGELVMQGGRFSNSPTAATNETWLYDGVVWRQHMTSNVAFEPRYDASLVYDEARDVVVLVNGRGAGGNFLRQVWEWDGSDWTQRWNGSTFGPPGTSQPTVFYDPIRRRIVQHFGLMYMWDGTQWSSQPVTGDLPPPDALVTVDTHRGVHVAYWQSGAIYELLGTHWTRVIPQQTQPAPTFLLPGFSFHYDSSRRVCVLYGREGSTPPSGVQQAWEWDGAQWSRRVDAVLPPIRTGHAAAFDGRNGSLLIHGGSSDNQVVTPFGDLWSLGAHDDLEITAEPQNAEVGVAADVEFSVLAAASSPITYRWRLNGGPLENGGLYEGVETSTLRVNAVTGFAEGTYDCVVTNGCRELTTLAARLEVTGTCVGDVTLDGLVNLSDLGAVLSGFGRANLPPGMPTDVDGDGAITLSDLAFVLQHFGTSCD